MKAFVRRWWLALSILIACATAASVASCSRDDRWRERFATTPFDPAAARWCERYHHAHYDGSAIRLTRSTRSADQCAVGRDDGAALSCDAPGCDPCTCEPPCAPCAKIGDVNGNAIVMTTSDAVGVRRTSTATFAIERQLPSGSHIGLYVALHAHCHTTVQGLLVADGPGEFHLNVAAFNQFIGGDAARYAACRDDPFSAISQPLASHILLAEDTPYAWRLDAELTPDGSIAVTSALDGGGRSLVPDVRFTFAPPHAERWFGVAGGAARYGFGAQFSLDPSPAGGEPALRLLEFAARP